MPEFLEKKLKAAAASNGMKGRKAAAYVYGTLNNMGAMRGSQETAKGAQMEAKHEAKMQKPAGMERFKGERHNYDFRRPKRKVVTRYTY